MWGSESYSSGTACCAWMSWDIEDLSLRSAMQAMPAIVLLWFISKLSDYFLKFPFFRSGGVVGRWLFMGIRTRTPVIVACFRLELLYFGLCWYISETNCSHCSTVICFLSHRECSWLFDNNYIIFLRNLLLCIWFSICNNILCLCLFTVNFSFFFHFYCLLSRKC